MDKYISIKVILDNILDHPMLKDVSFERAVNHTVNFMRIVGCPRMFEEKSAIVDIKDYRGLLPCDYESIIQVRTHGCNKEYRVFRYSTDNFHMSDNKQESFDLTYKIQGGVIFTSMRDGQIEIMYTSIAVDKDGYPLIPDNSSFTNALELYIKKKCFTVLFDQGKIQSAVYNNVCQEYAFAVGQAQTDLIRPTIDQMEALTNSLNTLVVRANEHRHGFIDNGTKEKIRLQ